MLLGLVIASVAVSARADFFDNFDSYANQAAMNAVWTVDLGTALTLSTANSVSAPNSVSQSTTVASRIYHYLGSSIQGDQLDFSFDFYYTGTGTRDFAQVYSRAGSTWAAGLNGALSFGTYNTTAAGKFSARFSSATPANGAIFGDGATIISTSDTTGWFALSVSKTVGWHDMEVIGALDPNHTGKAIYKFYVDGVLGGSIANAPDSLFNFGVIGGGVSSGTGSAANVAFYDNYSVGIIPEPSSLALLILGGLAMAGRFHRKI
jgi:hypothetical protein